MKKDSRPVHPIQGKFIRLLTILILLFSFQPVPASALELDPYPVFDFSRDSFSISTFREERPSFYWVNIGVPDFFFNGVQQLSATPNLSYSMRSVEYGVQAKGWVTDQLQVRATFPFEANALVDPEGNTHNVAKFGDLEVGATFLVAGKKEKGNFIGVDGRYRFATGTNPFDLAYPLLSTGKGAAEEAVGLIMAQELGGFSFFQSIHYEKTQPITLDSSNALLGPGVFQWPDNVEAEGRIEYLAFHRAERFVSLYYDLSLRSSGLMEFNHQALTYGQISDTSGQLFQTTSTLLFSKVGLIVKVDKEFSAEGSVAFFPEEFGSSVFRPADGWIFSLSLIFRPI
jgi:hypothetical protein